MKTPIHKMFLWFIVFLIIAGPAQAKAKTETVAAQPWLSPQTFLPGMPPCFDPQVEPPGSLSDSALPGAPVAPGDEFWDDRFDVLGVSGYVYAAIASGDDVYIGGNFNAVGGLDANGIARWNRTTGTWSALGEGIPGYIYAIAVSGRYVYAGGMFNATGGYPSIPGTQSIARWDSLTHTWSALGEGIPGYVYTMAVDGDDLYVGGMFNAVGGYPSIDGTQSLARWNITTETWSAVGEGVPGYVYALAVDGDDLYVGGMFNAVGGYPSMDGTQSIARWNITTHTWSAVSDGVPGYVYALAVDGDDLYVGGMFNAVGGYPSIPGTQSIARWNKTNKNWSALQEGVPGWVCAIAPDGGDLYVGGLFNAVGGYPSVPYTHNIAKWNGSAWSALGSGAGGYVNDIAIGADGIYIGGLFLSAGGKASLNIALWHGNGTNPGDPRDAYWDDRFGGVLLNGTFVDDLAVNGDDVYVAGNFYQASGLPGTRGIARWNSRSGAWSSVGNGINGGYVEAVAVSGNDVYIGGNFTKTTGSPANYIGRWDGQRWWDLGIGVNGGVTDIAIHGDYVYVMGGFNQAGGLDARHIARWNENSNLWEPLGSGIGAGAQKLAILPDGSAIVVGITEAGGKPVNYVAHWTGSSWSAYGSGLTCCVATVEASGGAVYIGGSFSKPDGSVAAFLARGTGGQWEQVGDLNGTVLALAIDGDRLFVGGSFTMAGNVPAHFIAKREGNVWSALGSGVNGSPIALVFDKDKDFLYAGGVFNQAGSKPSTWFGLWLNSPLASPNGSIGGQVTGSGGVPISGALVQVCPAAGGWCPWSGRTDTMGFYSAVQLRAGQYVMKAYSPASASLRPGSTASITLTENSSLGGQDLRLRNYQPLPSGVNLTPSQTGLLHVPRVSWNRPITLSVQGCPGGNVNYQITQAGAALRSGALTESSAGRYHAALAALTPYHGDAEARVTIRCPSSRAFGAETNYDFDLYIEPDHTVRTSSGLPVAGATVTLYAFDVETGVFLPVPNGDAVMSPINQANPDTTNTSGSFGWDLSEGVYKIRAKKAGCVAPYNPLQPYVETAVLIVPSDTVTGLDLFLDCGMDNIKIHLPLIQR
jgi:hypothetical protein